MGWVWEYLCLVWMLTKGSMMTQPVEICQPLSLDIPVLVRWASEQNCHCRRDGCYAGIWHGFTITWVDLATNTVECPISQQQKPQYVTISWGDQQVLGWWRDWTSSIREWASIYPYGNNHIFWNGLAFPGAFTSTTILGFSNYFIHFVHHWDIPYNFFFLVKEHISQWKR